MNEKAAILEVLANEAKALYKTPGFGSPEVEETKVAQACGIAADRSDATLQEAVVELLQNSREGVLTQRGNQRMFYGASLFRDFVVDLVADALIILLFADDEIATAEADRVGLGSEARTLYMGMPPYDREQLIYEAQKQRTD